MRLETESEEIFNIKSFFEEAVTNNRLASSYLFIGGDSSKKTEIARYLSKALNCPQALAGKDCSCDTCLKIENSNHPDVIWIKPSPGQKIKIETIRNIIRRMYLKPYSAKRKIFILEDAGNLTEEAQNAFLKTLEEPPADCLIILMARQKELLLETIVSRCQVVKFLSNISTGKADIFIKDFLLNKNRLELLGEFSKGIEREELEEILGSSLAWFRDVLVCGNNKENLCMNTNEENIQGIKETASRYSQIKLERVMRELIHLKNLIQRNVNPKIVLSILALTIEE